MPHHRGSSRGGYGPIRAEPALDLTAAVVSHALRGVPAARVMQAIASGVLGVDAYGGGMKTVALGAALHFMIMLVIAGTYYAACTILPVLCRRAVACGALYGIAVYGVMNLMVLPLSAFPHPRAYSPFPGPGRDRPCGAHVVCWHTHRIDRAPICRMMAALVAAGAIEPETPEMTSMRFSVLLAVAAAVTLAIPLHGRAADADLDAMVKAERDFAAAAQTEGVTAAFLGAMAEDSVLYRPGLVNGHDWYAKAPPAKITLEWSPSHAEMAASGDLGYTYGPWRLTAKEQPDEPPAGGDFFTIWERDTAGNFRVLLDQGIQHSVVPLATDVARRGARAGAATRLSPYATNRRIQELLMADRELARKLATADGAAALRAALAADAVVLRNGALPLGPEAVPSFQPLPQTDLDMVRVSAAGDIGATSGHGGDPKKPHIYQRAWRWSEDEWKLVVDVVNP